jgi:hypothetical protein
MNKLLLGFIAFAAVTIYAISRGGDVDISGEARGITYTDSAASAPASASAPTLAVDSNATLAKH